jgi:pimeloyl-ACP methyl ester carboxylesterase
MSSIVTEHGILHYETIGRGRPVILLHGWINSWDVWREAMLILAQQNNYRVYALDFWGFGYSSKTKKNLSNSYHIASYVEMVLQFMDNLGIHRAPIAGHSLGGTVALQFALDHSDRVSKVVIVGSPIYGASLNPFLKLAGYGWIASLVWQLPLIRSSIMHILLAGDSKKVRHMIFRDVKRASLDSFFRSIGDLRDTDLRRDIGSLRIPTLGIFGQKDNIVSPSNAEILAERVNGSTVAIMNQSRHFPMADEPDRFVSALATFLNVKGSDKPMLYGKVS